MALQEEREKILRVRIEDPSYRTAESLRGLYEGIWGFSAADVVGAAEVIERMLSDGECVKFLSFTGNLVSTGFRGLIKDVIDEGFADVIVTTCGALDHDIARSCGRGYFRGTFDVDDTYLERLGVHRLGNVFIPLENHGEVVERVVHRTLSRLDPEREYGVREVVEEVAREIGSGDSFLYRALEKGISVYVPGFLDGAFGTALLTYVSLRKIRIDPFKDERELSDLVFRAKRLGAIVLGGGISKHHTIWWSQFGGGLDYVVYVSTAQEYDGSLSGARPREAITWGKVKPSATHRSVTGDVTVVFPLILLMVRERVEGRRPC